MAELETYMLGCNAATLDEYLTEVVDVALGVFQPDNAPILDLVHQDNRRAVGLLVGPWADGVQHVIRQLNPRFAAVIADARAGVAPTEQLDAVESVAELPDHFECMTVVAGDGERIKMYQRIYTRTPDGFVWDDDARSFDLSPTDTVRLMCRWRMASTSRH